MAFLRVVEVLPPLFPASAVGDPIATGRAVKRFVEEVRRIRDNADVILVANVKDPKRLKFDSMHAASMLQEDLRMRAAPVVVVRDQNRPQFLSTVLTAVSLGLDSMMIAWGDDYRESSRATNVRDFASLAEAIGEAGRIRSRAHSRMKLFAPIDMNTLAYPTGVRLAKERLRAGADILLAQPPTTDDMTFDRHGSLLEESGLKEKVLPAVFHFRGEDDLRQYEKMFGWKFTGEFHADAARGERYLTEAERKIIGRLRAGGYMGVYLSTRGTPSIADKLLQ